MSGPFLASVQIRDHVSHLTAANRGLTVPCPDDTDGNTTVGIRYKSEVRPRIPRVLSRVATRMAIHLDLTLPPGSSGLPEGRASSPCRSPKVPTCLLLGLAPDEACQRPTVASGPVVSYTAVSPLPSQSRAVCSLLRLLSGHPGRTLSAIVLCGARKFLSHPGRARCGRDHQEVSQTSNYSKVLPVAWRTSERRIFGVHPACPK